MNITIENLNNLTFEELEEIKKNINTQIEQIDNNLRKKIKRDIINKFYDLIGHSTQYVKCIKRNNFETSYIKICNIDICVPFYANLRNLRLFNCLTIKGSCYYKRCDLDDKPMYRIKDSFEFAISGNGELENDVQIIPITQKEYEEIETAYNTLAKMFE